MYRSNDTAVEGIGEKRIIMEELQEFYKEFEIEPEDYIDQEDDICGDGIHEAIYPEITLEIRDKLEEFILKRDKNEKKVSIIDTINFWFNCVFEHWCYEANCVTDHKFKIYSEAKTRDIALCNLLVELKRAGIIKIEKVKEIVENG